MGKLYLHKKESGGFTTSKHTIVADIDWLSKKYTYEDRLFSLKKPKELIITGNYMDDFSYYADIYFLPVERVIIDARQIDSHHITLHDFINCKELILTDNCSNIYIMNNYGLNSLEHIIIPYTIECFEDRTVYLNRVNKITIKRNDKTCTIELDDKYKNINTTISAYNNGDSLTLNIFSDKNYIKYTFYYKDNELVYDKKFIRQEITLEDNEIDLIEVKKQYDCELSFSNINCEKIMLNKEDLKLFKNNIDKRTLKELIIKDNNEMKLIPNDIVVKIKNNETINNIEEIDVNDNKLYIIEIKNKENNDYKYYFINNDLTYYVLPSLKLVKLLIYRINELYIDVNSNRFKLEEGYLKCLRNLTIPKINNSTIIDRIIKYSENIHIKNKEDFRLPYSSYIYTINFTTEGFVAHYNYITHNKTVSYSFNPDTYGYIKDKEYQEKVEGHLSVFRELPYKKISNTKRKVLVKKYE